MRVNNETPVVVLRLDHWGALGVFRSLGRLGVPVYGVDKSRWAPALVSRYARGGFAWDLDAEPPASSVARLLQIAHDVGDRPLLVASNDETARFVAAHAGELLPAFRMQDNASTLVERLYNKRTMYECARSLDIPTAETRFPRDREEVRAFAAEARFPVMLKGSDGIALSRRSGEKMVIVRDADELLEAYDRLEDASAPDLMLQEYIPGGEDAQWMFNGYFDAGSRCRFGLTGRKLRQTPPYTGMTCLGVCTRNDEVAALTLRLCAALGYRGIIDIGFRYDARDGRYKVLDVNPRLGSTFRLFVDADGMDVVRALYLDLTGQPVPPARPVEGRRWLVEDFDLRSCARYFRDRRLTAREWLRSFAGVEEAAWFASDDPAPFAQMCGRNLAQAARKLGKRLGVVPSLSPAAARPSDGDRGHDERVRELFGANALAWQRVYDDERLPSLIYRHRHELTLRWAQEVAALPAGARVLDVGCGAGHTSTALAARGYRVHAVDVAPEMVALVTASARRLGSDALTAAVGDAHALGCASESFDLVVALGLLPWVQDEAKALAEMARVLRSGGWLIITADSAAPLHRLVDPRTTPSLAPLRQAAKRALGRNGKDDGDGSPPARRHDARALLALVRGAGLEEVRTGSVGFGQFTLLGRPLLSPRADVAVHGRLQRLADDGWPLVRGGGANHIVLARKPA